MRYRVWFKGDGYEYRVEGGRLIVTWEAIEFAEFKVGKKTYKVAVGYNLPEFPTIPPSAWPIEVEVGGKVYKACYVEHLPVFKEKGKLKTGLVFHLCK